MITKPYLDVFIKALLSMDDSSVKAIMRESAAESSALMVASNLLVPALEQIGTSWERGELALSQVFMSGRICEKMLDEILPPGDPLRTDQPPMGICVLLDYHQLGKRVIYSALRASGFELLDLGQGLSPAQAISKSIEHNLHILLISVLMLPSALHIKEVCKALSPQGIKVVVGGAPFRFDKQLWREVGADATGDNAGEAIDIVKKFLEGYHAGL